VSQPKQASNWSSIYNNNIKYHFSSQDTDCETKKRAIKKTAEVHVGPDFTRPEKSEELEEGEEPEEREPEEVLSEEEEKQKWAQWGLWRKGGKEPVDWCWEDDLRPY